MTELILGNEAVIRLSFFIGIIVSVATWEFIAPRRQLAHSRWRRWPSNFGLVFVNTAVLRVAVPVAAVGLATIAGERGWGILNLAGLPFWLNVLIAVAALDFIIYLQHVMFHAVPVLWRLHRMHHTDLDYDVTTGARFHPIEVVLSVFIKLAAVALIGAPAVAVVIFEVVLNATAMFNHGNIRIPVAIDRVLRLFVVTPDMHRVHHSIRPDETNSNFGFNIPWWDRLLGTYRAQPAAGHENMIIGLEQFRERKYLRLDWLVIQPFIGGTGNYAINRMEDAGGGTEVAGIDLRALARWAAILVLAAAVIWAVRFRDQLDSAALETLLGTFGIWAPLAFMALFAAATVLFLPGLVFALAGGALFGPVFGTLYNLGGATLGATAAFLVARYLASEWVARKSGPKLTRLIGGVEAEGWRFVAFVRLVPLFPFNLLNYALGLTRIPPVHYVVATAVCMIPGGFAYTYLGYAGREAIAGNEGAIQKGLLALGLLAAVVFLPRVVKYFRKSGAIKAADLARDIEDAFDGALLDVRDAADFAGEAGYVKGAINIPLAELGDRLADLEAYRARRLAIICYTDKRSKQAVKLLAEQGFAETVVVTGGMKEWTRQGLPVEGGG